VHFGLALPQYDYSVADERPLRFETIVEYARLAADVGFSSVWLSDHLFLDLAKYGGSPEPESCFEPLTTLAAISRLVPDVRIGTLVLLEALRPATVLAKTLATLDRVSGGRLDVGMGAGWYAPEYEALGMKMPSPGERLERLAEAVTVVKGLLGGGPLTFVGRHHRAAGARAMPPALQEPRPRVFVGGSGDRLLRLVAEHADGWNTCWKWTPESYAARLAVLERACDVAGRDPASVWRTLGLYALCGEDERDLALRWDRLAAQSPPGTADGLDLEAFRSTRLVGTVEQVREQVGRWEALGIETLIVGVGVVPFQVSVPDDVELLAHALLG
jgi:alkanesulfonate monooxygenase SsuD/methylene tetrahydromethanopterin reductase-like flavin-dependent oxidoreductase (luciferase family)